MSEPHEVSPETLAIDAAVEPGASPAAVAAGAEALVELARQAVDEPGAARRYHARLYELHERLEASTYAARRWLCQQAYAVEEEHLDRLYAGDARFEVDAMTPAEFRQHIIGEYERRSGLRHPLSVTLFDGEPDRELLRTYLRHQWYRSRGFYRELIEFSEGLELPEAVDVVANLNDEAGAGNYGQAHPRLLQRLLEYLDIPCSPHDPPPYTEALAYLNNRVRCARTSNRAWGLAVLFSLEYGTPATHGNIYRVLVDLGIPEAQREFHRVHMLGDAAHAEIFIEQILRLVVSPSDRSTFLLSLHHHRTLGTRYFDRIWEEIQRARSS